MKTPNLFTNPNPFANLFTRGTQVGQDKDVDFLKEKVRLTSAVIIAQNEADCIAQAIQSCQPFADEIIVVDGGSSDDTAEIAKQLGAIVYHNAWPGYAAQRNFAADKAKHNWIFFIDADEIVGKQLCSSILKWQAQASLSANAFSAIRIGDFLGEWLDGKPDSEIMVRLYDKRIIRIKDVIVHECPDVEGQQVIRLSGIIWHPGFRTISELTERFNRYTSLDAQKSYLAGKKFSLFRLIFKPPAKFCQKYIWHSLYKCGIAGFSVATLWSFYAFLWEIKLFEIYWQKRNGTAPVPKD